MLKLLHTCIFFACFITYASSQVIVKGTVTDANTQPLENVVVTVINESAYAITNPEGSYRLEIPPAFLGKKVSIGYSTLGYVNQLKEVRLNQEQQVLDVQLVEDDLELREIVVTAERSDHGVSNSSITMKQQAIELTQANSLKDIFSLLPGQNVLNSNLQSIQTFAPRTVNVGESGLNLEGAEHRKNAAFGTSFIVNGLSLNSNTNLTAPNSVTTAAGSEPNFFGVDDNATGVGEGLDLRTIAVENIESAEVVAGVASAKYGDYSDGAVIVNLKAGESPLTFRTRNRPGLINSSITKGVSLKKWGTLNLNAGYVYDNSDPTNDLKSFSRLNSGLLWTYDNEDNWRNTLSVNYSGNLDQAKTDPELNQYAKGNYESNRVQLASRGRIRLQKDWSESLNYNIGASFSNNQLYEQNRRTSFDLRWQTDQTENGQSYAFLLPFPYVTDYTVDSRQQSFQASIGNELLFHTGDVLHTFELGSNVTYNRNIGKGTNYDLQLPYYYPSLVGFHYNSIKPDRFVDKNIDQSIIGIYAEDRFTIDFSDQELDFSLGLRGDKMGQDFTFSPRLSAQFHFDNQFEINAAYGRNTKSVPLAYIYPNRGYYEFPLIDRPYFNNQTNVQYFPLQTEILDTTYQSIKPMTVDIYEVGGRYRGETLSLNLSAYYKHSKDGFTSEDKAFYREFAIDEVVGELSDGRVLTQSLKDSVYYPTYRRFVNALTSKTKGIELMIRTDRVESLATSFDLNTSVAWGEYTTTASNTQLPRFSTGFTKENLANDIYLAEVAAGKAGKDFSAQSALTTITNIPKIALVATIRSEFFWVSRSENPQFFNLPIGVYDRELNFTAIEEQNRQDETYADFRREEGPDFNQVATFANFHLRLSKEIGDLAKLSFYANNFLNYRPMIEVEGQSDPTRVNQEPQFGGEIQFSF